MGNFSSQQTQLQNTWNEIRRMILTDKTFVAAEKFIIDRLHELNTNKCNFRENVKSGYAINLCSFRSLIMHRAVQFRLIHVTKCMLTLSPSLTKDEDERHLQSAVFDNNVEMILMFLHQGVVPSNWKDLFISEGPLSGCPEVQHPKSPIEEVLRCWMLYKRDNVENMDNKVLQEWITRLAASRHLFDILNYDTCSECERERLLTIYIWATFQVAPENRMDLLSRQHGSKEQLELLDAHIKCLRIELGTWIASDLLPIILTYL